MILGFVDLPSIGSLFEGIATTSKPTFAYNFELVLFGAGIGIGVVILIWLIGLLLDAFYKLLGIVTVYQGGKGWIRRRLTPEEKKHMNEEEKYGF